jgi:hypothetical protein
MELESIEQRILKYLEQATDPVVPLKSVLAHVRRAEGFEEVSEEVLLSFLRKHELFRVLEPPVIAADPEEMKQLAAAGLLVGPQVILDDRMPQARELTEGLIRQLETMGDALTKAQMEAREQGNPQKARKTMELLNRCRALEQRLVEFARMEMSDGGEEA